MQFPFKKDGSPPGNLWIKENHSPIRWRSASESSISSSSSSVDSTPLDKIKVRHIIGRFVQRIVYTSPQHRNSTHHMIFHNRQYSDYAQIPLPRGSLNGYATFGEIIRILNFKSAVWDQKRRNYVFTLTELAIFTPILDYKMKRDCSVKTYAMSLGGEAQENFFNLIQEIVFYSVCNDNFERLRILKMLRFYEECLLACFQCKFPAYPSRFTGSYTLWKKRVEQIQKWMKCLEEAGNIGISTSMVESCRLDEIPPEIFYKIKQKLSNGDDVDQLNKSSYNYTFTISEDRLWKSLCQYNFKKFVDNISSTRAQTPGTESWRDVYFKLDKKYQKINDDCVENLELCKECNCLFWKSVGHPHIENRAQNSVIVKPRDFLLFFCE